MSVLSMQDPSWQVQNQVMLPNGPEMSGVRHPNVGPGIRSQDDANVGYFFQRPQTDMSQQYNQKRWAAGDDTMIEQARNVNELERDFQNLAFSEQNREMGGGGAKKIWDDQKAAGGDAVAQHRAGGMFPGPWSREDGGWNPNHPGGPPPQHPQHMAQAKIYVEHGGALPPGATQMPHLRRPGSFPGDQASVLSPRSSETGALGVNMAEYVLGGSPVGNRRMVQVPAGATVEQAQAAIEKAKQGGYEVQDQQQIIDVKDPHNGCIQNGLEDDKYRAPGSRQNSPTEGELAGGQPAEPQLQPGRPEDLPPNLPQQLHLDAPQFEPQLGIDPFQVDYASQLGVPSMDSPNFTTGANVDYSQLPQRPIAFLTQQQYIAAQQQQQQQQLGALGAGQAGGMQGQYVINSQGEQFVQGMPLSGQSSVIPGAYYAAGMQPPWGIYPSGLLQQQQQLQGQQTPQGPATPQQSAFLRGQTPRSLTPSQSNEGLGTPTGVQQQAQMHTPGGTPQYQILAPAYYDQNGQLVMGNGRGMGTPVRLVSPAPILVNQQGATGPIQIVTNQQGQQIAVPISVSGSGDQRTTDAGHPASHLPHGMSLGAAAAGLSPHHHLPHQAGGGVNPGAIGTGERRDSLTGSFTDYKRQNQMLGQYYSALGQAATSPAGPMGLVQAAASGGGASLTPPPSLTGSAAANLALAAGATGMYDLHSEYINMHNLSAAGRIGFHAAPGAPGADKLRINGMPGLQTTNGLFGTSLFAPKLFTTTKQATVSKEVTGRSRLLEDFRNNRIPNPQLKDLVNHVVEFSQDQHGSRFIQQKLERATPAEKQMVFNEILTAAYSLMTDVFGNYVIQKFFEFGAPEQKQTLAQRVRGHVLPLALQMYGCRVIQKALESIPQEMQVEIVKELDGHVLKCVKDQNGNHVVQKCIECIEPKHLDFLIDAFKGQILSLSTHPYGCRVIQRILEHCSPDQISPIMDELFSNVERLVQDQYGNYVIQHVLEHGRPEEKTKVVALIRGRVLLLSQHKFASNVVEKSIAHAGRNERAVLIEEICAMNDGALFTMMKDQFANYVVQKMIDVADPPQRKMLLHKIRPHVGALRKFTYGKHILAKLEKFYMKSNQELGPIGMPPNGALQ